MPFKLLFSYSLFKMRITLQHVRKNVLLITYEKYLLHVQYFFLNKQQVSSKKLMACLCLYLSTSWPRTKQCALGVFRLCCVHSNSDDFVLLNFKNSYLMELPRVVCNTFNRQNCLEISESVRFEEETRRRSVNAERPWNAAAKQNTRDWHSWVSRNQNQIDAVVYHP